MQSWRSIISNFSFKNFLIHRKQNVGLHFKCYDMGQIKTKIKKVRWLIIRRLESCIRAWFRRGRRRTSCRLRLIKKNLCEVYLKRLQFKKTTSFIREDKINWNIVSCSWYSETKFKNLRYLFRNYLWFWWTIITTIFYAGKIAKTISSFSLRKR